eukprot:CAMPEP_0195038388 /NCGR_PEP_ID=MMETSP0326_2-20130528/77281_1 /TAXON_ID=2866 ORGANISM="Crypthecodinium cohnii, Strain Seligo" /NCGR_SAMPLE_ID=MMETSP0326_2 /ASSEMBLY_ACC=CAM_ASM_000348 /LENGTH=71 /DNA_ID=CAMNT_0040064821 /DNA_START=125 /DNA_END=338 /DNA_ORIENTATION=+
MSVSLVDQATHTCNRVVVLHSARSSTTKQMTDSGVLLREDPVGCQAPGPISEALADSASAEASAEAEAEAV